MVPRMVVTCPACGGTSHDAEFCDHCNADLLPPAGRWAPAQCPLTPDATVELSPEQRRALSRPEAALLLQAMDKSWRVHWLERPVWEECKKRVMERAGLAFGPLAPCRILEQDSGAWVFVEATAERSAPWQNPPSPEPLKELWRLAHFLDPLTDALEQLHAHGLVWATFDPRELEEIRPTGEANGRVEARRPSSPDWRLRITNLDLGAYHAGTCPERLPARPSFAAPELSGLGEHAIGPATDVFHLALFCYYWLAHLLPDGFAGAGLEAFGHSFPRLRTYAPDLPPSVAGVIHRSLALDPGQRPASPAAFREAFHEALRQAERRWASTVPVRWQIGSHTRTGRTKSALDKNNEDYLLVRRFDAPERALLAVADGISTCDVGSGALASLMTCIMLENRFGSACRRETFTGAIGETCLDIGQTLLDWAIEKGYRKQLENGLDLMGTTLIAGWLEDNSLTLANLGDSRAYLISGGEAEQLTVDGDLGSELLAEGTPPEQVRDLAALAKALRDCVGGCVTQEGDRLKIVEQTSRPDVTRWPLQPGDVVVLCSDGLVEEGAFLDPATMAEIVQFHPDLAADDLALRLAEAADALQRLPSPQEPEGYGDNITCIVVKVTEAAE
jgi:serine/threonine protein phosphatase PrpC